MTGATDPLTAFLAHAALEAGEADPADLEVITSGGARICRFREEAGRRS